MHIPNEILEHFGLCGQEPVSQSGKIDRTLCWRFTTNAGDVLLVAAQSGAKRENVKRRLRLGGQLAALGAPVDRPCSADDLVEEDGLLWYRTSYDGEPKSTWDHHDFVRAGETLACFHTTGELLNERPRPPRGHLTTFLDKVRRSVQSATGSPDLAAKLRVMDELQSLSNATNFVEEYERIPKVLTHGDFCDRNVVWKDRRCTLIDLELCGMEIALFDLAFFTCEFIKGQRQWGASGRLPDSNGSSVFNALMEGYRAERELIPVGGDLTKVVMLLTIAYRFYDAPRDADWVDLADRALGWKFGSEGPARG